MRPQQKCRKHSRARTFQSTVTYAVRMTRAQRQKIWKYNTCYHLISEHTDGEGNVPPFLPQMVVDSHNSKAEEVALDINPETTDEWRTKHDEHDLANSSDVEDARESLKRGRMASSPVAEPRAKSRRTRNASRSVIYWQAIEDLVYMIEDIYHDLILSG